MSSPSPERAVVLLALGAFCSSASFRGSDALLPLMAAEFNTTAGNAAAVITAFAVAYGLLQIVHGPLGDRYGKFQLVSVTTALSALSTAVCALAPTLGWLIAARFAAGAVVGAVIPVAMAWIGDVVPYEKRQTVLARFLIGQLLGIAVGTAAGGYIGEHFGWRALFWVLTVLLSVVSVLLWLELRSNPLTRRDPAAAPSSMADGFRRMAALLARPWVRAILITGFFEGGLFYGAMAFVAFHMHYKLGLGIGASGTVVTAFGVGGLLYAAFSRRLVSGLGERGLARYSGITLGCAFFGLLVAPSAAWVYPCMLAAGAGLYMLHNTLQVHATQMAPESRGAALALFALFLFSGQSAGVWLGAKIVDTAGATPLFLAAAIGLPALAFNFRRLLTKRMQAESKSD